MSERLKRLQARQELLEMWDEVEPSKNEEIARRALDIAYRYLVKSDNQADHIAALEKREKARWIPVTERQPYHELAIVQYSDGDFDLLQFPTAYRWKDIVAWMPLPEPYKGE